MSKPEKADIDDSSLAVTLTVGQLRAVVRAEIEKGQNGHQGGDRLLGAKEASALLAMSEDWLYRNAHKLSFTRKLGRKVVRFSYQGIQKYLASKKVF